MCLVDLLTHLVVGGNVVHNPCVSEAFLLIFARSKFIYIVKLVLFLTKCCWVAGLISVIKVRFSICLPMYRLQWSRSCVSHIAVRIFLWLEIFVCKWPNHILIRCRYCQSTELCQNVKCISEMFLAMENCHKQCSVVILKLANSSVAVMVAVKRQINVLLLLLWIKNPRI